MICVDYWWIDLTGVECTGWALFKHEAHAEEFIEAHPEFTSNTVTIIPKYQADNIRDILNFDTLCDHLKSLSEVHGIVGERRDCSDSGQYVFTNTDKPLI